MICLQDEMQGHISDYTLIKFSNNDYYICSDFKSVTNDPIKAGKFKYECAFSKNNKLGTFFIRDEHGKFLYYQVSKDGKKEISFKEHRTERKIKKQLLLSHEDDKLLTFTIDKQKYVIFMDSNEISFDTLSSNRYYDYMIDFIEAPKEMYIQFQNGYYICPDFENVTIDINKAGKFKPEIVSDNGISPTFYIRDSKERYLYLQITHDGFEFLSFKDYYITARKIKRILFKYKNDKYLTFKYEYEHIIRMIHKKVDFVVDEIKESDIVNFIEANSKNV